MNAALMNHASASSPGRNTQAAAWPPVIPAEQREWPIAAQGVTKSYGGQLVLDRASFGLQPGAVLGLVGRNGAGKSTLIRVLLGLIEADSGAASLWGQPSLQLDDASKARLGYVPQQPEALAWLKIGDMLDFVGRFYPRWDARYVNDTLDRWELPRNRLLAKLSPGERQRVALIRALASQPDLLVLDEPAAALDPVARRDLLREIAQRAGESGTSVLFSSHIVSDLERVASHVAFLHQGRMLLEAEMDTLKERHRRLLVPATVADQLVGRVPGEIARRQHGDGSLALVIVRDEDDAWPAIVEAPGVRADAMALEDMFIEVAG